MNNVKEINLSEILSALLRKAWLIVVFAVLAGALTYAYTANFITPLYRSRITIYVNNTVELENANNYAISAGDLATSQRLVATYINILESDRVLNPVTEAVEKKTGKLITPSYIRGRMSANSLDETEIFEVIISDRNPKIAAQIANSIADVAPGKIEEIIKGSSAICIDKAVAATAPYTPNRTRNTTFGMIGGALAAAVFIVLQTLMDVRVKGEEDLAAISKAPVLGLIPDLAMEMKGEYGYSGYQYSSQKADTKDTKSGGAGA